MQVVQERSPSPAMAVQEDQDSAVVARHQATHENMEKEIGRSLQGTSLLT